MDLADALAVDKQQQRQFGLEGRVAQLDALADVLAGDLEEAAVPADGAVVADLAALPVEKDVLEADVPGDRSQVIAAGQEVIDGRLLRHLVDAAVVLAGDPGGVSLPQLADRQRRPDPRRFCQIRGIVW